MVEHANYATGVCKTSSRRNAHGGTRKLRDRRVENELTSQRAWWNAQIRNLVSITQLAAPIVEHITLVAEHADDKNLNHGAKANTGWVTSPIISPESYGLSIKRCLEAEISNR